MKKILLSILLMLLPILASADPVEVEEVWYNLIPKGNVAEVTSKPSGKYTGDITILDKFTYDGVEYNVTKIADNAFKECEYLSSVIIGNSVTSIGTSAFEDCSGLTSVTIPNSVTYIGSDAFQNCFGLTSVHISDIESWCGITFSDYFSNPLLYAGHLYLNGEEVKELVIPNSLTSIGSYAFLGCSGLTSVTIPNSVTSIGADAFGFCSSLTSIDIPNNLTSIGNWAFEGCSGLTSATIPNSVESIGKGAFRNCSALTSVIIPNSVESISDNSFSGCSSLISVTIPNSVTSIGNGTFANCSSLTSVTIPNGVTSIGYQAFSYCSDLTSLTIPNSVTSIGQNAFYNCSALTSVTIGNSVKAIDESAFGKCEKLADVYCLPEKVRNNSNNGEGLYTSPSAFKDSYQEYITLHVPAASAEAYGALEPWKSFKEIVALNGEDIPEIPVTPKCAMPTISLVDGKITFSCETEGVEYISEVTVNDAKKYYDNEISAPKKFKVTVYATKASYDNSDTATAEFDFSGDTSLSGDVDGNGIVNVADHVKLSDIIMNK